MGLELADDVSSEEMLSDVHKKLAIKGSLVRRSLYCTEDVKQEYNSEGEETYNRVL